MEQYISRTEHDEFAKRMEAENKRLADEDARQNKRLDSIEKNLQGLNSLAASVERLATNMEGMLKEQEKQGKRLETLEGQDGKSWQAVKGYIFAAVASALASGMITLMLTHLVH